MRLSVEQVRDLFHRHELRCTRQRELVYMALETSVAHPTAEELYQEIHTGDPGLSLATVYNTLDSLLSCGLARKLSGADGGPARYDAVTSPHVHLATPDGRMADVPGDLSERLLAGLSPALIAEVERRLGVCVTSLDVQLKVCE